MSTRFLWLIWLLGTSVAAAFFGYAVTSEQSSTKMALLPGETSHGHYQIELSCNACHTEFMGVKQDACKECHGADLKREKDTHPSSKFNDPTNADRLAKLDAQNCITCHREHVPDRTHSMGLSLPNDYCFHCHEDVADQRPSHEGMSHDSCSTVGCHNYHDNRAIYENFLYKNCDQPDVLDEVTVLLRAILEKPINDAEGKANKEKDKVQTLVAADADSPSDLLLHPIVDDWAETAHAQSGVNCRGCHEVTSEDAKVTRWVNKPGIDSCQKCHDHEAETFVKGRHGMRLALDLSPMTPGIARLPMHAEMGHKQLDCSACHEPHRYDTKYAATQACMKCHDDEHTNNYINSNHYELWKEEVEGTADLGTGVSCATCHMPRVKVDGKVRVDHNQNANLRPKEKMIRSVCMSCHGLEFSLNSLADSLLIQNCFDGRPTTSVDSAQMAKRWFQEKEKQKAKRLSK